MINNAAATPLTDGSITIAPIAAKKNAIMTSPTMIAHIVASIPNTKSLNIAPPG